MSYVRDVELDDVGERMLNLFQHACALASELAALPPWEQRRRRRLRIDLALACQLADESRDVVADLGDGYTTAPRPLERILADAVRASR